MQPHALEVTFAPTWRVCEENSFIHSYTCTNRLYAPNKETAWMPPHGMGEEVEVEPLQQDVPRAHSLG